MKYNIQKHSPAFLNHTSKRIKIKPLMKAILKLMPNFSAS